MGIKLFNRGNAVIVITPVGKNKVENYSPMGAQGKVLTALFEVSPCTLSELAEESGMSPERVKGIIKTLVKSGYARWNSSGE